MDVIRYNREVLVDVLVHHRPTPSSACRCGGVGLGRSWPEHIADVYETSVAARSEDAKT